MHQHTSSQKQNSQLQCTPRNQQCVPIYNRPFHRIPEHSKFYRKDSVHQPGHSALRETKQGHSVHQTRTLISRVAQGLHKDKLCELTF